MTGLARTDTSIVGHWWWTVDRWSLGAILVLIGIGIIMVMAASPPVALRNGADSFHFVNRHLLFILPALSVLLLTSLLSPEGVRRAGIGLFAIALALTALTLIIGSETKGAQRWLPLGSFKLQPSELLKPALAILTAWLLASYCERRHWIYPLAICLSFAAAVSVLALQPDFGMSVTIAAVWMSQIFLAGLPLLWILGLVGLAIGGLIAGYHFLNHVQMRVDSFLDPTAGDGYQVGMAKAALIGGGLWGRGPGEGVVKNSLPDAHADFIFAVAGEEFGAIAGLLIVGLFCFLVLRGLGRIRRGNDLFIALAAAGLLIQFALQAFINIGVNLAILPTKGTTLPFLSYGGSSLVAVALTMGMVLALTRRREHAAWGGP